MKTYICLLRGINVSGKNKLAMKDLKAACEKLGLKDVTTYIQSGNVVFRHPGFKTTGEAGQMIRNAIQKNFGLEVPVLVLTAEEFVQSVKNNPFLAEKNVETEKLHITFLSDIPADALSEKLKQYDYPPDRYITDGTTIYLYTPGGYGNTKLSNNFFESKLKVTATTRNWKTVNELVRMIS